MKLAYHASHEQFGPARLMGLLRLAERSGFNSCVSSDHFHPWARTQGQSGFAWAWLGAALQATGMEIGVVSAPGQRYHPAVLAQAAATLEIMYPGRFWLAVGSGELLNERITGQPWPAKAVRNQRLLECAEIDGLLTVAANARKLHPMMQAFGAGKPVRVKLDVSCGPDEETARSTAWEQWRVAVLGSEIMQELGSPQHFEQAARFVRREDISEYVALVTTENQLKNLLDGFREAGVELVSIHNVNLKQEDFLGLFGQLTNRLGTAYYA